jgi:hypothetical protein
MPAIDLARLKIQVARLSEKFREPIKFVNELNELLDFYTNRTIRTSQIAQRLSLRTYNTPAPVLRQIKVELLPLAETESAKAIALTDALWKSASLESRLLAAFLLGCISPVQAIPSFSQLPEWLSQSTDNEVRTALLTDSFARVRRENPEAFFILLEDWLKSSRSTLQAWGLRALLPLLAGHEFQNLPAVFRILKPAIGSAGPVTQLELQVCLSRLYEISPIETLAFLREILRENHAPLVQRTLRRILVGLSPELPSDLRETLREGGKG